MWKINAPEGTWLIHPHHLDLAQPQIAEDLTSRLDRPNFRSVIESDIVSPLLGMQAHAQSVDQALVASGKPPYARRLATTIFLHSLTQGIASGVDPADLMLAVLEPDASGAATIRRWWSARSSGCTIRLVPRIRRAPLPFQDRAFAQQDHRG